MGSSDRRPYLSALTLDQDLLDESADNLTCQIEMIADIIDVGSPAQTLRVSDRAKYVGGTYYEPRVTFPTINRTIGDWLAGQLEFSDLTLTVNNTDKKFSAILPGGSDYDGFIGKQVQVKVGLGEIFSSYTIVFSGVVTDISGFQRGTDSFTLKCRNDFDTVNVQIPNQLLIEDDWPDIENEFIGLGAPIIYGDWTTDLSPDGGLVPAYPVNGLDPLVNGSLDPVDPGAGDTELRLVISSTPISLFDDTNVQLLRGNTLYTFAAGDIAVVGGTDNQVFDITQKNLTVDGSPWIYNTGDQFFVRVKGIELAAGAEDDNIVSQAQDMLIRFGGLTAGDFDSTWATIKAQVAPSHNAIANIKSRVWIQESIGTLDYVLSMLEQVRLELFVSRENKFRLSTLHFEDFQAAPAFTLRNWDIQRGTFTPQIDDRNNFNRAKAEFSYNPSTGQQRLGTPLYKNQAAVTQAGRAIDKLITFPNLYDATQVVEQLKEILKLSSAFSEFIEMDVTWRSFLKDISDEMTLNVSIGSVELSSVSEPVTAKIRSVSYNPQGLTIGIKLWSFQLVPFPGSTKAGVVGVVGGSTATIEQVT